jgi:hypothetical protein
MEKLDKILHNSLHRKAIGKVATSAEICFYASEWGNGRFEAVSFLNGTLKLSVPSSPAAADLEIQSDILIDAVNKKCEQNLVKSVRIIIAKSAR